MNITRICALSISILLFFSISSLADIRSTEIRSENQSLVFIDAFGFNGRGRIQLNVSHISILNPNNLYLSEMGLFGLFLTPKSFLFVDSTNYSRFCLQNESSPLTIFFILDKLNFTEGRRNMFLDVEFSYTNFFEFNLYFKNCLPQVQVSMDIQSAMYNVDAKSGRPNYLTSGKNYLFAIYFALIAIYLSLSAAWIIALDNRSSSPRRVFRIHYVMLVVLFARLLSFALELVNLYHIKHTGYAQCFVVLLVNIFGGVPLFILVALLGRGWSFLSCKFQRWLKNLLIIIITLQLAYNIGKVYYAISLTCDESWCLDIITLHRCFESFSLFGLVLPTIWTTRHLLRAGQVEGKAKLNFKNVKLLRRFFFAICLYSLANLLLCLIEAFALLTTYTWMSIVLVESETLALYVFLGRRFWPEVGHQIPRTNDDEEIASAEALKDVSTYDLMREFGPPYISL